MKSLDREPHVSTKRRGISLVWHRLSTEPIQRDRKPSVDQLDSWHWFNAEETEKDLLTLRGSGVLTVDLNDAPRGLSLDQYQDDQRELPAATGVHSPNGVPGGRWCRWAMTVLSRPSPSRPPCVASHSRPGLRECLLRHEEGLQTWPDVEARSPCGRLSRKAVVMNEDEFEMATSAIRFGFGVTREGGAELAPE